MTWTTPPPLPLSETWSECTWWSRQSLFFQVFVQKRNWLNIMHVNPWTISWLLPWWIALEAEELIAWRQPLRSAWRSAATACESTQVSLPRTRQPRLGMKLGTTIVYLYDCVCSRRKFFYGMLDEVPPVLVLAGWINKSQWRILQLGYDSALFGQRYLCSFGRFDRWMARNRMSNCCKILLHLQEK